MSNKQTQSKMNTEKLYKLADTYACKHVNYLKSMNPYGFTFKQAEAARERFRNNRLKYWEQYPDEIPSDIN